jgi:presenilin-like A22 family membrane protease
MSDAQPHPLAALPKGVQKEVLMHGGLVFVATSILTIAAASVNARAGGFAPSEAVSVPYFLLLFFLATALIVLTLRSVRRPAFFEALFAAATAAGAWFAADAFLPPGAALVAGSLVIVLRYVWKSVLMVNLALAVGIAGIAAAVGADLSTSSAVIILAVLSFYDIFAVYGTGHMVRMFRGLASHGVIAAFLLTPLRAADLLSRLPAASGRAMLLGSGDVALPLILAAAAARTGPVQAAAAALGAVAGFGMMVLLFLGQERCRPMPALPPIAFGSVAFYLLSLVIFPA